MNGDVFWITLTVALDLLVACGYIVIAMHWWRNARLLPAVPAKKALASMRNIFVFCGMCGYLFIPVKMFWPAWRLYDFFMAFLVYFTWDYAWNSHNLKVVYSELGRTTRLAEELRKAHDDAKRKSLFLNALSHDLRTPLNGLMLQTSLAEVSLESQDADSLKEAFAEIKASARTTAALLDGLLECARLDWAADDNHVSEFDLSEVLAESVGASKAAADAKGLSLTSNDGGGLRLRTDRMKLERVLSNLIVNAAKFTEKGSIRIEVQHAAGGVDLHVIDTGVGIAPEHQERLFDEFYQVHNHERDRNKGFGLGLAIARRLARQLGGDVSVQSALGRGSRFTLSLPDVLAARREAGERPTVELVASR